MTLVSATAWAAARDAAPTARQNGATGLTLCQPGATLFPMPKKPATISDQVRAAIDASGLSRRRICAEIDLDEASMSKFMSRERGLSMEVLDRLGLLLDLSLRPVKPAKRPRGA